MQVQAGITIWAATHAAHQTDQGSLQLWRVARSPGVLWIQSGHGMSDPQDCSGSRQICTLSWSMLITHLITACHRCTLGPRSEPPQPRTLGWALRTGKREKGRYFTFQDQTYRNEMSIAGTNSPIVRLWEVRAVAVSGPTGEMVKFVFPEESFLPPASAASVCGMKSSGASEDVWLFLAV